MNLTDSNFDSSLDSSSKINSDHELEEDDLFVQPQAKLEVGKLSMKPSLAQELKPPAWSPLKQIGVKVLSGTGLVICVAFTLGLLPVTLIGAFIYSKSRLESRLEVVGTILAFPLIAGTHLLCEVLRKHEGA